VWSLHQRHSTSCQPTDHTDDCQPLATHTHTPVNQPPTDHTAAQTELYLLPHLAEVMWCKTTQIQKSMSISIRGSHEITADCGGKDF